MTKYHCTDEASGGAFDEIEAATAEEALAEYIADALKSPDSYNQGEEGVSHRIRVIVYSDDDDQDRATGWIEFPEIVYWIEADDDGGFRTEEVYGDDVNRVYSREWDAQVAMDYANEEWIELTEDGDPRGPIEFHVESGERPDWAR